MAPRDPQRWTPSRLPRLLPYLSRLPVRLPRALPYLSRLALYLPRLLPNPAATAGVLLALLGAAAVLVRLTEWHPSRRTGAILLFACLAACAVALHLRDRRRARRRLSDAHGSARWGDPRRLAGSRGHGLSVGSHRRLAGSRGHPGLILGRIPGGLLRLDREGHLLTLAPTGAGKGVAAVLPNLLDYPGSVLCTDVKGEAYAVSGRFRRDVLGQTVAALDPFDVAGGDAAYNPLDLVDPASDLAHDHARLIAAMLVVPEPGQREPFWDEEAASLIAGVILHVAATAPAAERHLGAVRHVLTLGPSDFSRRLDRMIGTDACHGLIRRAAQRTRQKDERLLAGVLASTNRHTEFLDSPQLLRTVAASTFRLADLKQWKLSIYLILPPHHLRTHGRWLRLVTAAALRVLTLTPGHPAHRVLLLLDEFAALGRMQSVEEAIAYARGYGVSIWMLAQDLAQLRDLYPRSWGTLLANLKVLQAFGTADQFTAEHLSRLTGQATVRTRGSNRSRGSTSAGNWWLPHQQQSVAEHAGEAPRGLLLADEVRRLPAGRQLLFVSGEDPMHTARVDYRTLRRLAARADPNPMYRRV